MTAEVVQFNLWAGKKHNDADKAIRPGDCWCIDSDVNLLKVTSQTDWVRYCDSPIEQQLLRAIVQALDGCKYGPILVVRDTWILPKDPYKLNGIFGDSVLIHTQAPILDRYRADILIVLQRNDCQIAFAVECDGHEWHEKTKEQALRDKQRDREFKLSGVDVLRFTGREIYRGADKCAGDVKEFCHQKWNEIPGFKKAILAEARSGGSRRVGAMPEIRGH